MLTNAIPKKNKCKKAKWLSEEALKIAEKRREAKDKGERERYTQLNAEFQRIAGGDKKTLSKQCKEIEENNRVENTRDIFKKIGDNQGNISCIDRYSKRQKHQQKQKILRGGKNTHENCTKKVFMTWITMMVWSPI